MQCGTSTVWTLTNILENVLGWTIYCYSYEIAFCCWSLWIYCVSCRFWNVHFVISISDVFASLSHSIQFAFIFNTFCSVKLTANEINFCYFYGATQISNLSIDCHHFECGRAKSETEQWHTLIVIALTKFISFMARYRLSGVSGSSYKSLLVQVNW